MMFRIVRKNNFDKDWYDEEFVNLPLMPEHAAKALCLAINVYCRSENSEHTWEVVPKDYKLYIGIKP